MPRYASQPTFDSMSPGRFNRSRNRPPSTLAWVASKPGLAGRGGLILRRVEPKLRGKAAVKRAKRLKQALSHVS